MKRTHTPSSTSSGRFATGSVRHRSKLLLAGRSVIDGVVQLHRQVGIVNLSYPGGDGANQPRRGKPVGTYSSRHSRPRILLRSPNLTMNAQT